MTFKTDSRTGDDFAATAIAVSSEQCVRDMLKERLILGEFDMASATDQARITKLDNAISVMTYGQDPYVFLNTTPQAFEGVVAVLALKPAPKSKAPARNSAHGFQKK